MILDLATQAYNALRHNRRRSVLTMLGMAWGIATVVLLLAYGTGFERGLWSAFRSFGTNLVFIFPGRTELQAGGTKAGTQVRLTVNDLDSIRAEVPLLKRVSPEAFKNCVVAFGTRSSNYGVSGVYASYGRMRKMDVAEGTFFSEADDFTHTRVAVIGSDAKKKLFSGQNALGRECPPRRNFLSDRGRAETSGAERRRQYQRARLCSVQRHERSDQHLLPELGRHGIRRRPCQGREGQYAIPWRSTTTSIPRISAPSSSSTCSPI